MSRKNQTIETLISRRDAIKIFAGAALGLSAGGCRLSPNHDSWLASNLDQDISGKVITSSDKQFESVCRSMIWNGVKPKRHPDAIVQVSSVADVQATIRYAKRSGMKIAVRGGGHSWCASALRESGIMLDLGALREVNIDPGTKRVLARPAVTNSELSQKLALYGLAFPVGHCPSVPLSGYLLSGGFGWNSGAWGPACMSVRSIEVVTAAGTVVRADDQTNSDLFWAARGGGAGFFGVIAQYELQAYPMPQAIQSVNLFFPWSAGAAVGSWLAEIVPVLSKEVELTCVLGAAPPGLPPAAPQAGERMILVAATAFANSKSQAQKVLAPVTKPPAGLRAFVTPLEDTPLSKLLTDIGALFPEGARYGVDVSWCNTQPQDLITRLLQSMESAESDMSFVLMGFLPPPQKDTPAPPDLALSMFAPAFVGIYGIWREEPRDALNQAWVARTAAALKDVTVGHYVGESDLTVSADRSSRCYSPEAWKRLRALKEKYDPTAVFHDYPTLMA